MTKSQDYFYGDVQYNFLIGKPCEKNGNTVTEVIFYRIDKDAKRKKKIKKKQFYNYDISELAQKSRETIEKYHDDKYCVIKPAIPDTYLTCPFSQLVSERDFMYELRALRGWNTAGGSTADSYRNALINQWGEALGKIPFCKITTADCDNAMDQIKGSSIRDSFSLEREGWLYNVLRQAMALAVQHGYRKNNPVPIERITNLGSDIKRIVKARRLETNTITCDDMADLYERIKNNYRENGAWLAVCHMLFCGVRPSEACGALFEDFEENPAYKDEYYIRIIRQKRSGESIPDFRLKTDNAYRYTPIASALADLILEKKRLVEKEIPKTDDIRDYPIACKGSDFGIACTKKEINDLVKTWAKARGIDFGAQEIVEDEKENDQEEDSDEEVSAYMLRRNAATMMVSLAAMTEEEAIYILGHSARQSKYTSNDEKIYRHYTSWDQLHDLQGKLNRIALWMNLYGGEVMDMGTDVMMLQINEKDVLTVHSTLEEDECLEVAVTAYENDDPIQFELCADSEIKIGRTNVAGLRNNTRETAIFSGMRYGAQPIIRRRKRKGKRTYKVKHDKNTTRRLHLKDSRERSRREGKTDDVSVDKQHIKKHGGRRTQENILVYCDDRVIFMKRQEIEQVFPGRKAKGELAILSDMTVAQNDFSTVPCKSEKNAMFIWSSILAMYMINAQKNEEKDKRYNDVECKAIPRHEEAIVVTRKGYANRVQLKKLKVSVGPGTGQYIIRIEKGDSVAAATIVQTGELLLIVNSNGWATVAKSDDIKENNWQKCGLPLEWYSSSEGQHLGIPEEERDIVAIVRIPMQIEESLDSIYLVIATNDGHIKKMSWQELFDLVSGSITRKCIIPCSAGKRVVSAFSMDNTSSNAEENVVMLSNDGYVNCFSMRNSPVNGIEQDGDVGIKLENGAQCVFAACYSELGGLFTISQKGVGKISRSRELIVRPEIYQGKRAKHRLQQGEKGIIGQLVKADQSGICSCLPVSVEKSDVIVIAENGKCIRRRLYCTNTRIQGMKSSGYQIMKTECAVAGKKRSRYGVACVLISEYEDG